MKKIILLISTYTILNNVFSQDIIPEISKATCNCIGDLKDTLDRDLFFAEFGVCVLKVSKPYSKKLKKKYNIDLNQFDKETGSQLGKLIGADLAVNCPTFLKLVSLMNDEKKSNSVGNGQTFKGTIISVEKKQFITIVIRDESGSTTEAIWLNEFEGSSDFEGEIELLKNKIILISLVENKFYDPNLNIYRVYNEIVKIKISE